MIEWLNDEAEAFGRAAETDKLRELVGPVYDAAADSVGQENLDRLLAELDKVRGGS